MDQDVKQVLLGSMLGDGHLSLNKKNQCINASFVEMHHPRQKEYLLWKKEILEKEFTVKYTESKSKSYRGGKSVAIYTWIHPILTKYHQVFYPNGVKEKTFSTKILKQLTPMGLAVWYMDDGHLSKWGNTAKISTHPKEIMRVKEYFESLLSSKCTTHQGDIHFKKDQTKKFFDMIKPYIHQSMQYKLKVPEETRKIIKKKKKEYLKKYRAKNKEKIKISQRQYHKENREKLLNQARKRGKKKYRELHPLKEGLVCLKCSSTFNQTHCAQKYCSKKCSKNGYLILNPRSKEKAKECKREYYQKNKEEILKRMKINYRLKQESEE